MSDFVESTTIDPEAISGAEMAPETLPDLSDFAEDQGGALPPGWVKGEVIEGYASRKGFQFETADVPSNDGNSRNLRICFKVTPKSGDPRNLQEQFNYRPSDFTPERIAYVKEARIEFKGVKGRWADADVQRSSLALANLGQLQKALGFQLPLNPNRTINVSKLVGQVLDLRLRINDQGYNEVGAYEAAGKFTGKVNSRVNA